jgi:basic membrane protein A and related proteins
MRRMDLGRARGLAALALVGVLAAGLAACGDDDDAAVADTAATDAGTDTTPADTDTSTADTGTEDTGTEDAPTEPSGDAPRMAIIYSAEWQDGSWGQTAFDGANQMLADGVISDLELQENVQPGADGERALRALAEEGWNPIIAHSFNFGDDVKRVAEDYPDTIFVYAGGFGDVAGNVGDYSQPFYQATYLSGILAAGVVDGDVGGAGGFDIPVCRAMYNAFLAGAQLIDPDTAGSYVAVGDWYDVQLAKEATLGQVDQGATMFVGCGQGPTFGQIEAANEIDGVATGYVGDMSEVGPSVLSSFTWNLAAVFTLIVDDVAAGSSEARYYEVPLSEGGMEVVISPEWIDQIPAEVMATYDEQLAAIQDGSFEVPYDDQS